MTMRHSKRSAFTILELLIVIGIIVIIATLGFLFLPNLDRNKGVPNATTQLEGWINLSKQAALRDKKPHGVRFLPDDTEPLKVKALQYIEQPDPVAPQAPFQLTLMTVISGMNPPVYQATLNIGGVPQPWEGVEVGDLLQVQNTLNGVAVIKAISGGVLTLDKPIPGSDPGPVTVSPPDFKVIRSPRPLTGEPTLKMNKDVYIDLVNCYPCPRYIEFPAGSGTYPSGGSPPFGNAYTKRANWSNWETGASLTTPPDILFNASGFVANATTGQIILAVRHNDRPNDMLFVTIYTYTGKITSHKVNDVPGGNPYVFAQDGSSSGF